MKLVGAVFFLLTSIASAAHAEILPANKISIEKTTQEYVRGFRERDWPLIKQNVSSEFILATGGEQSWKTRLKRADINFSRYDRAIHFRWLERHKEIYIQFSLVDKKNKVVQEMADGQWFKVAKIKGRWVLDLPVNDFHAE